MKFISIVGFVASGIMVLAGFLMFFSIGFIGAANGIGAGTGIIYIILAAILFFPYRFLFFYAKGVNEFYNNKDNKTLEIAFKMQKGFWKFFGILLIIYLALIGIAAISFILAGIL